ncbi:hypothetical protein [Gottfriedia acidiceleris]|uniref:Restriction endonuclease n=1 Tax=Gottfriedia acidiceleris TaxID=371036 RepID=A0ABY4JSN6_9BACI|nr:hypothetical protein [Gottfriedia acidiceleris]UPM56364.1 hypothetical protein MY490_11225 [Gottfriedia acidiceleris]
MKSLLGYLGKNFISNNENLATEALNYILDNSFAARSAITKINNHINPNIDSDLSFQSQVYSNDNAIPDIVGFDTNNDSVYIIEAKFWAGLTRNQPITYLNRLDKNKPSILIFLVPKLRMELVWGELIQRLNEEQIPFLDINTQENIFFVNINHNKQLAITNWDYLLNEIISQMTLQQDELLKGDVLQLLGLCSEMDNQAFLPIHEHEISPMIPKRNMNYSDIVDELFSKGMIRGIFSTENGKLRSGAGAHHYKRYFKFGEFYADISFDNRAWLHLYNTPFWLKIYGKKWSNPSELNKVRLALSPFLTTAPKKLYTMDLVPHIPLFVKYRVEKSNLVDEMLKQVEETFKLLKQNYF